MSMLIITFRTRRGRALRYCIPSPWAMGLSFQHLLLELMQGDLLNQTPALLIHTNHCREQTKWAAQQRCRPKIAEQPQAPAHGVS